MHKKSAIVVFSVPPQFNRSEGDELFTALTWDELDILFTAILEDVVEQSCQLDSIDIFLYRNEKELSDDFLSRFRGRIEIKNLQERFSTSQVQQIIENLFMLNYIRVIVILENNPLIHSRFLLNVINQLDYNDECIVFGPTTNGRCFVIGMNTNQSVIFSSQEADLFQSSNLLLENVCRSDAALFPTKAIYSLNSGNGLIRLKNDIELLVRTGEPIPHRTFETFKLFDKKYRFRKFK